MAVDPDDDGSGRAEKPAFVVDIGSEAFRFFFFHKFECSSAVFGRGHFRSAWRLNLAIQKRLTGAVTGWREWRKS